MLLNLSVLNNINQREELVKGYSVYAEEYRSLNPGSYFKGNVTFHYLDPYLEELKPFFINYRNSKLIL
jgi:hypothetical protein